MNNNPEKRDAFVVHPFIQKVRSTCSIACVSGDTFNQWKLDVKTAFKRKNCYALSLKDSPGMEVDSRPLLERITQLETVVQQTGNICNNLQSTCSSLQSTCKELLSINKEQMKRIECLEELLVQTRNLEMPPPPNNCAPSPQGANGESDSATEVPVAKETDIVPTPFDGDGRTTMCYDAILHRRYPNQQIPVPKLFLSWFTEQLPVAYENYKLARMNDPTRMEKKYHTKVKNHFSICKTAVHVVLKNLDKYPTRDEDDLEALANFALDKIRKEHGLNSKPSRTKLASKGDSIFKLGKYKDREFPEGTPSTVESYFNNRGFMET